MLERDAFRERMFLKGVILLFTALYLGAFFWVALQRMNYPYELEWGEGIIFQSIARACSGAAIHGEPSVQWAAPAVNPLYIYLCAALEKIFGQSAFLPRLLSLMAFTGSGFLFYRFLRKTGVQDVFALAAIGIYLGFYHLAGSWYDLAHPTSLAIFLGMAALTVNVMVENKKTSVLSGILAASAFFTQVEFAIIWILLALMTGFYNRRLLKWYLLPSVIFLMSGLIFLHIRSGGWYWIYAYHSFTSGFARPEMLWSFWWNDLLLKLPILSVLSWGGFYGLVRLFIWKKSRHSDKVMAVMVTGFFTISFVSGFVGNNETGLIIPAVIAVTGLSAWSLQHFSVNEYGLGWLLPISAKMMIIIQLMLLIYRPNQLIPTQTDLESGDRFIAKIAGYPGEIFIPCHPDYLRLAGKGSFADLALLENYCKDAKGEQFRLVLEEIDSLIVGKRFSAIIIDEPLIDLPPNIRNEYRMVETIFQQSGSFYQRTGYRTRPQYLYQPK